MARNSRNKKIYFIAITIYLFVVAISLLICFLLEAPGYTYALVPFGITIIFLITFFISCYDILYKINPDDIDEIKKRPTNITKELLIKDLTSKGFERLENEQIFYKSFFDKKKEFKRFIFITESHSFDLSVENFLKKLQKFENIDKASYFETYIIMFSNTSEYSYELQKENRANSYVFSSVDFSIVNKLFKCLIFNENDKTVYYYKIKIYPKSLEAVDFIENDLINDVEAPD